MSVNPATAHSLLLRATHVDTQMNYYDDWRRLFFNLYGSKIKKNCVSSFVSAGGSRPWHSHHSPHTHTHTDTVQVQWSVFGVLWHLYGGGETWQEGEREREKGVTMATEAPKFCNAASTSPPDVGWIKTIRCQNYDHWHVGYLSWRVCSDTSGHVWMQMFKWGSSLHQKQTELWIPGHVFKRTSSFL